MQKKLTPKAKLNVIKAYAQIAVNGYVTVNTSLGIPIGVCRVDGTFAAFNSDHYRNMFGKYMEARHRLSREHRRMFLEINKEQRLSK